MANSAVAALAAATLPLTGTELLYADDGTSDVKVTTSGLRGFFPAQMIPYFADTNTYLGGLAPAGTGTTTPLNNYVFVLPIVSPVTRTYTSIKAAITTAQAAQNFRMGVLNAAQDTGQPTTVVADSGDVSTAATGLLTATISAALTASKLYYLFWTTSATTAAWSCPTGGWLSTNGFAFNGTTANHSGGMVFNRAYAAMTDQSANTYQTVANGFGQIMPSVGIR